MDIERTIAMAKENPMGGELRLVSEIERLRAKLAAMESHEPFAYCFTDVNGKPTALCDSPDHAHSNDGRLITSLYAKPVPADKPAVGISKMETASPSHSQQSEPIPQFVRNVGIAYSKYANAAKTYNAHLFARYEQKPVNWVDNTSDYYRVMLDAKREYLRALDAMLADILPSVNCDRCPSHESEQGGAD